MYKRQDLAAARGATHSTARAETEPRPTGHIGHRPGHLLPHHVPHLGLEHGLALAGNVELPAAATGTLEDAGRALTVRCV